MIKLKKGYVYYYKTRDGDNYYYIDSINGSCYRGFSVCVWDNMQNWEWEQNHEPHTPEKEFRLKDVPNEKVKELIIEWRLDQL